MPRLSTHVLDTAQGRPAVGIALTLSRIEPDGRRVLLCETRTNQDGRTDRPLLEGDAFAVGRYEIVFQVGDYFRDTGLDLPDPPFLDVIPLGFGIGYTVMPALDIKVLPLYWPGINNDNGITNFGMSAGVEFRLDALANRQ